MTKVLFICLGNICRSPAAEGVFQDLVINENLSDKIFVDSAGTIGNHEGQLPDARMRKQALLRGIELKSRSRKFNEHVDFDDFDYIITMDNSNYKNIKELDINKKYNEKIFKLTSFCKDTDDEEVPDPYWSGEDGFELVLNMVTDGSTNLLKYIKERLK